MTAASQPASNALRARSRPTSSNKLALIDATWVCHHLPELAHFTHADKAILCGLIRHIDQAALDAGRSTVWPSTLCLSLDTGYTVRQVVRSLARLEAHQLICRFTPPRWRTAHTDLSGFMAMAADALEAHAQEKDRQLQAVRRRLIAALAEPDTESSSEDIESPPTETDIEPAIFVGQANDALRGRLRRRPDTPAAADCTITGSTGTSANGQDQSCSPSRAGLSAGVESGPSIPAEMPRGALVAAWEASPTFRRLVDIGQLHSAPVEQLAAAVERDYLVSVTGIRNPHHIWAWAMNRHGLINTILGWLIACDTPPSAERPDRNPGGWFTRFATAERPWNLARNLRQLARAAVAPTAAAAPSSAQAEEPVADSDNTMLEVADTDRLFVNYRAAWLRIGAARYGRQKAEAAWKAWLGEAAVHGIDDDRLQIRVKVKVAGQHLDEKYGDLCRLAAEAIGYEGVDFEAGCPPR